MTMTMTMMFSSCLLVHWERLVPTCSLVCSLRTLLFKGPIFIPGKFLPALHHEIFSLISPGMINGARPIGQRPVGLAMARKTKMTLIPRIELGQPVLPYSFLLIRQSIGNLSKIVSEIF